METRFKYSAARSGSSRGKLVALTAFVLLIFGIDLLTGGKLRAGVRAVGNVFAEWAGAGAHAVTGSGIFSTRASLEARNRELEQQLSAYEEQNAAYAALKAENDQLKSLVHLTESAPRGVTARIISSVTTSPYGTFTIGAGQSEGVKSGDLVMTSEGFVIGRVTDASVHSSLVKEIFAPQSSIEGDLAGATISVQGQGSGNAHANVPRGVQLALGDIVTAPSLGRRPIGLVGKMASSSGSASQDVFFQLPVNLAALQFIYVTQL